MPEVVVRVRSGQPADVAYERIADFASYPKLTEAVVSVDRAPTEADGAVVSAWTVRFRNGLLRWTERDVLDPVGRTIEFVQLTGDFVTFTGNWRVVQLGGGSSITFRAEFDLGIPSLASIIDPVAQSTLRSNILRILTGLLGEVTEETGELEPVVASDA